MFDALSGRLNQAFSQLRGKGRLSESDVNDALREVRIALLEADVNVSVVKSMLARVKERAVRSEVTKSLTPGQQVIKIVRDELIELLGEQSEELRLSGRPAVVLLCGLQGSGKTTTLYAILTTINKPDINIITIEDPVEYQIKGISQIQVNPKIDLTFARGLRSIVRQDPDVILIGEIRDKETADIAVQSALTGHLVFSTLHTIDAAKTVERVVGVFPVSGQQAIRMRFSKAWASGQSRSLTRARPPDLRSSASARSTVGSAVGVPPSSAAGSGVAIRAAMASPKGFLLNMF